MQDGPPIPWFIAEAIYTHLYRLSGQTLERLGERGGFGWAEVEYMWSERSPEWGTTAAQRQACREQVNRGLEALIGR